MTRIIVNQGELAATTVLLENAAGEYTALGTNVCGCDCGCMPADVASVVDAVTAEVRSGLIGIAGELASRASDLGVRAEVDQNGSTDGGYSLVVGGSDLSFPTNGGGYSLVVGGGSDLSFPTNGGGYSLIVGGSDLSFPENGGGYSLTIGGSDLSFPETGGGYSLTIPGTRDDFSIPLGPVGDPFWDDPAGWLASMQPASRTLNDSGFMVNIPGVSIGNALGHLGMINEIFTHPGPGEIYWNDFEGSAYERLPGESLGTRL